MMVVSRIVTVTGLMGVVPSARAAPSTAEQFKAGRIIYVVLDLSCFDYPSGRILCLRRRDGSERARTCGFAAPTGKSLPDAGEHRHGQSNGCAEDGAVRSLPLRRIGGHLRGRV